MNTPERGIEEYKMPSIEVDGHSWIRLIDHIALVDQQLQKARERWLRNEIVRLNTVKPVPPNVLIPNENPIQHALREGKYSTFQIIIERYQSELEKNISK